MNDREVKAFCKTLKVNDIIKVTYNHEGVTREIIAVVIKLDKAYMRTTIKCIMDNDSHKRNSILGETFTMNLLSHSVWDLTKL